MSLRWRLSKILLEWVGGTSSEPENRLSCRDSKLVLQASIHPTKTWFNTSFTLPRFSLLMKLISLILYLFFSQLVCCKVSVLPQTVIAWRKKKEANNKKTRRMSKTNR